MKLLLDENVPKKLKQDLKDFDVYTVRERGWNGKSNGELIKLMIADRFDALVTFDKNLEHQQNFQKYPITVFALNAQDNTYLTLKELVPTIRKKLLEPLTVGVIEVQ